MHATVSCLQNINPLCQAAELCDSPALHSVKKENDSVSHLNFF